MLFINIFSFIQFLLRRLLMLQNWGTNQVVKSSLGRRRTCIVALAGMIAHMKDYFICPRTRPICSHSIAYIDVFWQKKWKKNSTRFGNMSESF